MKSFLIFILLGFTAINAYEFNLMKCIKDAETIFGQAETLVHDIKNKTKDISGLLDDLSALLNTIPPLFDDCGISKSRLEEYDVLPGDLNKCISDLETVAQTAVSVVNDIKGKDFSSLFNDAITLYNQIKQTVEDCKSEKQQLQAPQFDFLTCIKDALDVVQEINNFLNDYNNKKSLSDLISDLQTIVSSLQTALPACGAGEELNKIEQEVPELVGDCLSDLAAVVQTVQKIKTDVDNKDISGFINDATALISQIQQVIAECKVSNIQLQAPQFDFLTCIKDALDVVQEINNFLNDYNNKKSISDLISDLQTIVSSLQTALPACGAGEELNKIEQEVPELVGDCLSDISAVVQTVQKIKTDVDNKDISGFINDATALISQIQQVIAECKVSKVQLQAPQFDFLTCIKDAIDVVKEINNFLNDYNNKKSISDLISDLQTIVSSLQTALPACGAGEELNKIEQEVPSLVGDCLSDLAAVVQTVQKIKTDVDNKDISGFINDATALISQIQQVVAECKV